MATWYSVDTSDEQTRLLAAWSGAPIENLEVAAMLLEVAQAQVLHFAPAVFTDAEALALFTDPPARYVYAQLQQAQTLWAAGRADENGGIGSEGFSFTPRPMDKNTRAIIRPVSGAPDVL